MPSKWQRYWVYHNGEWDGITPGGELGLPPREEPDSLRAFQESRMEPEMELDPERRPIWERLRPWRTFEEDDPTY
jgi:hypothetical protein